MKTLMLCVLTITLTTSLFAQKKVKEIGINISASNDFGITYKIGNKKSLWRFNLLSSNIGVTNQEQENKYEYIDIEDNEISKYDYGNTNYGFGLSIGKEFRNLCANKLEFKYGFDLGLSYNHRTNNNEATFTVDSDNEYEYESINNSFTPFINAVLGFNYLINNKIIIGIEVLPKVSYSFGNSKSTDINYDEDGLEEGTRNTTASFSSFNFNVNSDAARLTLAYRF